MKNWKRYLSIAMTLVMLLGVLPTAAFAEEGIDPQSDPTPVTDLTISLAEGQTGEFTYTGSAQVPTVTVSSATVSDLTSSDYTLIIKKDGTTVAEAVNAGDYTITAQLTGITYSGESAPLPFKIKAASWSADSIQVTGADSEGKITYSGSAPEVKVMAGSNVVPEAQYTLTYKKGDQTLSAAPSDVGSYTVTASPTANYTGEAITKNYTITAKPWSVDSIQVTGADSEGKITYSGSAPEIKVMAGSNVAPAAQYTLTYKKGTETLSEVPSNAGSYTVTASPTANYEGTPVSKSFTIVAKTLTAPTVEDIANQTYTGSAITPTVTVKDGETTLTKDKDYTVSYSNHTNAAAADAQNAPTATVKFKGNYAGNDVTKTFTISPKNISAAVLGGLNTTYNPGSRPVPTVTLDGKTLVEGNDKDYTLSYDETTTPGSLIITVTGRGNYTGSKQATVAVLGTSDTTAPVISGVTNGGTYHEAKTITVTDTNLEKVEIYQGTTLVNTWNLAGGTTTVSTTLALSDTDTAYVIKAYDKVGNKTEFTVTVTKKSIAASMITIAGADNIVFDGTAKTPTITVKDGSTTIAADQYTLRWENNTNAGTATVKVTMNSNAAYKGEATKTFTIKPKTITSSSAIQDIADQTYTGSALTPAITVKDGETRLEEGTTKDYTVIYSNNTNPGTAKVTVVLRGNYQGVLQKTFTINPNLTVLADNIKTLAAKTTLTYAEKQQIKQLKAAYDALSAENKAIVDSAVGSTLMASFKSKASAAAYKLLNKPSVGYYKYVMGTSSNVVIEIDADYSRTLVTEIRMGKYETVIDPANYEVKEGSVVVTLSSSYLKTVKNSGKYNLYIDLMDIQTGRTETLQTVVRVVPATDIPQTGDPFQMNLWIGLLGASVLALAGLGVYEVVKKKKDSRKRLEAAMDLGEESPDEANINE